MKTKTQIVLNSLIWIIISMAASMAIIYILMEDYAREFSVSRIKHGISIIDTQLVEMKDNLVSVAGRISRQVTGKLELINDPEMQDMAEEGKRDLTIQLYKLSRVSSVPLAVVYGENGKWISFVRSDDDLLQLGFSIGNEHMMSARIPVGNDPPEYDQWKKSGEKTVFPAKWDIPSGQGYEYGKLQGLIRVNTWMPIMTEKMDKDTLDIRHELGGMVMVSGPVDSFFCKRLSILTGGHVNFFLDQVFSAGTLDEYKLTDRISSIGKAGKTGISVKAEYRDPRFSDGTYFEGKFPIFNKQGYLGAVSILYSKEELKHFFKRILMSFIGVSIFCIILVIPFSLYFAKRIFSPITKLVAFMEILSKGNFTQLTGIQRKDEIGLMAGAMEKMSFGLGKIIQKNISVSQDLLDLISSQAPSLEETSASLEEIEATSDQNSENAGLADLHIREVRQMLGEIRDSMNQLNTSIEAITVSGKESAGVIKTIDAISFQTNLLALNASVEAARAGESGAGFSVVASEIRNLASKTAEAAQNTASLIRQSIDKMSEGSKLSAQVKIKFEEIIKRSDTVSDLINNISTASYEQHRGIEQINKSMDDIELMTRQIVAGAETLSHSINAFTFEQDL